MKGKDDTSLVEVFAGSLWEAELTKGLLESNGIESVVKDGIMGTLAPYISPEVSIMVNESDYKAATEMIRDRDKEKAASNR
ncbi:MAG: DUF2007 domain-containing protein [Mediterranea sp.]|jgi:hypothetical protein|nr:DUF2007 domain-containing protein [Mediterranea sp.]